MNVDSFKSRIKITCSKDSVKHVVSKMLQEAVTCDCYLNLRFQYVVLARYCRVEKCVVSGFLKKWQVFLNSIQIAEYICLNMENI